MLIQTRLARLAERGNPSQLRRASGSASSAAVSSGGSSRFSTASRAVQEPSARAAASTACPGGAIIPAASSRAMRSLLGRDQPLPRRRGVSSSMVRRSSTEPPFESTQPKQSASSTTSAYGTCWSPPAFLWVTTQIPAVSPWWASSHSRHCAREVTSTRPWSELMAGARRADPRSGATPQR